MNEKHKEGSSIFRQLVLIILATILGINLYMVNANKLGGNNMPMPFGLGMAVVMSGSMEPCLKVNDLIIVQEKENYQEGDIIVYQTTNQLVVHRIISINGDMLTTQGDANNVPDDPIEYNAVKGTVIAHISFAGVIINVLKTPVGILLILLCAILLIELSFRRKKANDDARLDALKEEIRRLKDETEGDENKTE